VSVQVVQPSTERDWELARGLVKDYVASVNVDLWFQNIDHELLHLPVEYGPPRGAFFIALEKHQCLGCVGLREFDHGVGEIKRLYIAPSARGLGLGRTLIERLLESARELKYNRLVLDTLPSMKPAQALYKSLGFVSIPPYRFNPVEGTEFLGLNLREG
jgi:ribosomal protein S18 acetylase RimI-like enzyme